MKQLLICEGFIDEDGKLSNNKITWKTIEEGTSTAIVAAFDPSIAGTLLPWFSVMLKPPYSRVTTDQSGAYLEDCRVCETEESFINDPEGPEKLWKLSEMLVGQKFDV